MEWNTRDIVGRYAGFFYSDCRRNVRSIPVLFSLHAEQSRNRSSFALKDRPGYKTLFSENLTLRKLPCWISKSCFFPTAHRFGAEELCWKPWEKCEVSCIRMANFQISVMRRLDKEYLSACKLESHVRRECQKETEIHWLCWVEILYVIG
jgi:hypothetical protein